MEKYEDARGAAGAGDGSEALLAESARCYANQVKAFLAETRGPQALGGLDTGQVTAFTAGFARDRRRRW